MAGVLTVSARLVASTRRTSTGVDRINHDLHQFRSLITNVGVILLMFATTLVVLWALVVLWRRAHAYQVIFPEADNASGVPDLDPVASGLTELVRETLGAQLENVYDKIAEYQTEYGIKRPAAMTDRQLPRANSSSDVDELSTALNGASGTAGSVMQLVTRLIGQRGLIVDMTLQRQTGQHGRVGLSFRVTDVRDTSTTWLFTWWEPQASTKPAYRLPGHPPPLERYCRLLEPVAAALAVVIARDRLLSRTRRNVQMRARVLNYAGLLFLGLGSRFEAGTDAPSAETLYQLSIEQLRQARKLWPEWFEPDMNAGTAYSYQAELRERQQTKHALAPPDSDVEDLHRNARDMLLSALDKMSERRLELRKALRRLTPSVDAAQHELDLIALKERRARLDLAFERLHLDPATADADVPELSAHWRPDAGVDGNYLYNVMSWWVKYAERSGEISPAWKETALRCLAYSIVRDKHVHESNGRWARAMEDPDVISLFGGEITARTCIGVFHDHQRDLGAASKPIDVLMRDAKWPF